MHQYGKPIRSHETRESSRFGGRPIGGTKSSGSQAYGDSSSEGGGAHDGKAPSGTTDAKGSYLPTQRGQRKTEQPFASSFQGSENVLTQGLSRSGSLLSSTSGDAAASALGGTGSEIASNVPASSSLHEANQNSSAVTPQSASLASPNVYHQVVGKAPSSMHAMMENIVGTMEAGMGKVFASPGMRTKGEGKKVLAEAERVAANLDSKMHHNESTPAGDEGQHGVHPPRLGGGPHAKVNIGARETTPTMTPSRETTGSGL
ncbi:hypothetical protein BJ742DRAFT_852261 [Cladochytrium replicatum]|nr:hypothetical protein BJ742DRAFT_852261 [Cladochytrium replicatum]